MISLAEDVRDIAGWPAIEWGMTEEEVREVLVGRVSAIMPIARFANSYAPIKGSATIDGYPFEVVPQFSHATGELCQVLFRAADADAERIERMSDLLTVCYGSPVEGETKRTWWGPEAAVELDTVRLSSLDVQLWLRWYPIEGTEADDHAPDHRDRPRYDEQSHGVRREVVAMGAAAEANILEAERADMLVSGA